MVEPVFALATTADLAGWLGEPIDDQTEQVRAGWALAAATGLVLDHTGKDETTWKVGEVPGRVVQVVLACAARAFTNPEAWQYESVDDWRAGGRPVAEAGLFLTDSEKRALTRFAAKAPVRGLGVIATSRPVEPARPHTDPLADTLLHGTRP